MEDCRVQLRSNGIKFVCEHFYLISSFEEGNTLHVSLVGYKFTLKAHKHCFSLLSGPWMADFFLKKFLQDSGNKSAWNYFSQSLSEACRKSCHTYQLEIFFLYPIFMELSFPGKKNPMNNLVFKNYENCSIICVALRRKANFAWQIERVI